MNLVPAALDIMAHAAHNIANSVRESFSKVPVLGHLFEGTHMGALQNPGRNQKLVALSQPESFIYA